MAGDVSAEVVELFLVEAAVELKQGEANDQVVIAANLVPLLAFELVPEGVPVDAAKVLNDFSSLDVAVKGDELVPMRLPAKRNEIVPWDYFLDRCGPESPHSWYSEVTPRSTTLRLRRAKRPSCGSGCVGRSGHVGSGTIFLIDADLSRHTRGI